MSRSKTARRRARQQARRRTPQQIETAAVEGEAGETQLNEGNEMRHTIVSARQVPETQGASMNPRIIAALFAKGLISEQTEAAAALALPAFFAGRGRDVPTGDGAVDTIVASVLGWCSAEPTAVAATAPAPAATVVGNMNSRAAAAPTTKSIFNSAGFPTRCSDCGCSFLHEAGHENCDGADVRWAATRLRLSTPPAKARCGDCARKVVDKPCPTCGIRPSQLHDRNEMRDRLTRAIAGEVF